MADDAPALPSYSVGQSATSSAEDVTPVGTIPAGTHWQYVNMTHDTTQAPICNQTAHTHDAAACGTETVDEDTYNANQDSSEYFKVDTYTYYQLTCTKEVGHVHDDSCYSWTSTGTPCTDTWDLNWLQLDNSDPAEGTTDTVGFISPITYIYTNGAWYVAEKTLTCTKEENHVHSVADGCYQEVTEEAYDQLPASEQYREVTGTTYYHYTCGQTAHEHTDACYPAVYHWTLVRDTGDFNLTVKYGNGYSTYGIGNAPAGEKHVIVKLTDSDGGVHYSTAASSSVVSFKDLPTGAVDVEVQYIASRSNSSLYEASQNDIATVVTGATPAAATITATKMSSSNYFNHIDIQAGTSFTYKVDGKDVTAKMDLKSSGYEMSRVSIYYILNNDPDQVHHPVYVSGSWESASGWGSSGGYEYQIPGVFPKAAKYYISCDLPVTVNGVTDTVTYSDIFWMNCSKDVCPGSGTSEGMDPQLSAADLGNFFSNGTLKINKDIIGGTPSSAAKFSFSIYGPLESSSPSSYYSSGTTYYSVTGEGYVAVTTLPVGTYVVKEVNLPNGYTVSGSEQQAVLKLSKQVTEVTFTNYYDAAASTGTLRIVKTMTGLSDAQAYSFTVAGPGSYSNTVTLNASDFTEENGTYTGAYSIPGLAAGDYTVTETDADVNGYDLTTTGSGVTQAVKAGKTTTFSISNNYVTEADGLSYTVQKVWSGDNASQPTSVDVELLQNGNSFTPAKTATLSADTGWKYTWTGLTSGSTYTVRETTDLAGYQTTYAYDQGNVSVTFPSGTVITPNNTTTKTVDDAGIIAIKLKAGNNFVVWTKTAQSMTVQAAIVKALKAEFSEIKADRTTFYSGTPVYLPGVSITSSGTSSVIAFTDHSQWAKVGFGTLTVTNASDAVITNTYSPITQGSITVTKNFSGLESTNDLPESYAINVTGDSGSVAALTLDTATGAFAPVVTNNGFTYTWTVTVPDDSLTYTATESNAAVSGYNMAVTNAANTAVAEGTGAAAGTYSQSHISGNNGTVTFNNAYTMGGDVNGDVSFTIRKVDSANAALSGAIFTLYGAIDATTGVPTGSASTTAATDSNGQTTVTITGDRITADADHVFYLKETQAPTGYDLSDSVWTVTVTQEQDANGHPVYSVQLNSSDNLLHKIYSWLVSVTQGTAAADSWNAESSTLTLTNVKSEYTITVNKTDGTHALPGAAFSLAGTAMQDASTHAAATAATTSFEAAGLNYSANTMTVSETTTPGGYTGVADFQVQYALDATGAVTGLAAATGTTLPAGVALSVDSADAHHFIITVANTISSASLSTDDYNGFTIAKVNDLGAAITGANETATFSAYTTAEYSKYADGDDSTTATAAATFTTSAATGLADVNKAAGNALANGTYVLVETSAPAGYAMGSTAWSFSVTSSSAAPGWNGTAWETVTTHSIADVTVLGGTGSALTNGTLSVINRQLTSATISKTWVGGSKGTITVQLYQNGTAYGDQKTLAVADMTPSTDHANTYLYTFTNLPGYTTNDQGQTVAATYTVAETAVGGTGYTADTAHDDLSLTNTYSANTQSFTFLKVWNDLNNNDRERPAQISVQMYYGTAAVGTPMTLDVSATGSYDTYSFSYDANDYPDAAQFSAKEVGYYVTAGSTLVAADSSANIFTVSYDASYQVSATGASQYAIINSYEPATYVNIPVVKTWSGNYSSIPANITVALYANGVDTGARRTMTASTDNSNTLEVRDGGKTWIAAFLGSLDTGVTVIQNAQKVKIVEATSVPMGGDGYPILYKYNNGTPVVYTVVETAIDGVALNGSTYGNWTVTYGQSTVTASAIDPDMMFDSVDQDFLADHPDSLVLTLNNNYYYNNGGDDGDDIPPVVIPDNPTPGSDTPTTPPTTPSTGTPTTDIPNEETPKASQPEATGDNLSLWIAAAGVSGVALIWAALAGRKRKEDDAQ